MLIQQLDIFFTTISVNKRVPVFKDFIDIKSIVLESFEYLKNSDIVDIYSFVIMNEHVHIIWQVKGKIEINDVVTSFKKYTGRKIVKYLQLNNEVYLEYFLSGRFDRDFKIWKIKSKNIKIIHPDILIQKINYIHYNPVKAGYESINKPEDYYSSSAIFYAEGKTNFNFLTSYLCLLS